MEVAKGKMAGLVPDSWAGNGSMEATTLILFKTFVLDLLDLLTFDF